MCLQRLHAARHIQRHLQPLAEAARRQAAGCGAAVQPLGQRAAAASEVGSMRDAGSVRGMSRHRKAGQLPLELQVRFLGCDVELWRTCPAKPPMTLAFPRTSPSPPHLSSSQTSQKSPGGRMQAAYSCMTCGCRSSASASTSRTNVVACSRLRGCTRFTATQPPRHVAWCTTPARRRRGRGQ